MTGRIRDILVQACLLVLILTVGIWVRSFRLGAGPPEPKEAAEIRLVVSGSRTSDPDGRTYFHSLAGACVRFMGNGQWSVPVSYYRLVPLTASVLTVFLVLGLGLHRRGGLLGTPDAVLWGTALVAFSPDMVASAWSFSPVSTQILLFGGLLLTMRSYAQWPGMLPAALFGILAVLLASVTPDALWTLTVLLPAVIVGVGWRRICLYWRTWHIILMLCCGACLIFLLSHVGLVQLPEVPKVPTAFLRELADRVVGSCLCGLALIAWGWVAVWAFMRPDRRFVRVVALLFLFSFWASFFFEGGGPFAAQLAVLSPLVLAVALSTLPSSAVRWTVGHLLLAAVCALLLIAVIRRLDADRERTRPLLPKTEVHAEERIVHDESHR